ncbi:MAG: biotin--[acetyl-CoA-carboxylase] ligase [Clostridia bacterium]|nr:biotin--[acetyl-CoA-carboxylase] ligase [Clostridia bacterium]
MIFDRRYFDIAVSTNDTAKLLAARGGAEGVVVVASSQTGGRGRLGRRFYSPSGGLYMSLILRPRFSDFTLITPAAAVAVCRALGSLGFDCGIKWVNDIYKDGKKVCGILTESNVEQGWAVLGVGINTVCPGPGAPDIAGWLYDGTADNRAVEDAVLEQFDRVYSRLPDKEFIEYYRQKSCLPGKTLLIGGREYKYEGIGDDLSLIASSGGVVSRFTCGDVSIKTV